MYKIKKYMQDSKKYLVYIAEKKDMNNTNHVIYQISPEGILILPGVIILNGIVTKVWEELKHENPEKPKQIESTDLRFLLSEHFPDNQEEIKEILLSLI